LGRPGLNVLRRGKEYRGPQGQKSLDRRKKKLDVSSLLRESIDKKTALGNLTVCQAETSTAPEQSIESDMLRADGNWSRRGGGWGQLGVD